MVIRQVKRIERVHVSTGISVRLSAQAVEAFGPSDEADLARRPKCAPHCTRPLKSDTNLAHELSRGTELGPRSLDQNVEIENQ